MVSENLKKAQSKASSPEARAKAVATTKRRRAEKEAAAKAALDAGFKDRNGLLKHAKKVTKSIPLDMIPDMPTRKKYTKKTKPATAATRQEVVLALLRYLDGE